MLIGTAQRLRDGPAPLAVLQGCFVPRSTRLLAAVSIAAIALTQPPPAWSDDSVAESSAPQLSAEAVRNSIYQMQHRLIWEEAAERGREAAWEGKRSSRRHRSTATSSRRAAKKHTKSTTARRPDLRRDAVRGARAEIPEPGNTPASPYPTGRKLPFSTESIPANVRANNPAGDAANAGQAEVSLAAYGNYALLSWNDGQGFADGSAVQGIAISYTGGQTWADIGSPPVQPGWALFRWRGDPVVTVNQKTGEFYLFGLGDLDRDDPSVFSPDTSAILMARGHLSRVFVWDAVQVVRARPSNAWFLDKEWAVADTANGNLYLVWTEYDKVALTDQVLFSRSGNEGATWSSPVILSSVADAGDVQGARVAVGPFGVIHAVWFHNDPGTALFNLRFKRSLDGGVTWETQQTPASYVANSGTGAPGFNRTNGIDMPSLAVDRTEGQFRGRVYVAFSESYNYGDDTWASQPAPNTVIFESEPNNTAATADPFIVGQTLRGTCGDAYGQDWFSFTATAGQHVIVWLDSLPSTVANVAVIAVGGVENLALGQGGTYSNGFFDMMYTITAPYSGIYYVRVVNVGPNLGAYRIRTKFSIPGSERGRDRRDVFATWSQDGTGGFSTPIRVCDNAIGSDDYLPEIVVGPEGCPYLFWFDERLDTHMARTHVFASRSNNGGASWVTNHRITDSDGSFTTCGSNITPNMGDYLGVGANDSRVIVGWGDPRGTDVDTWTESVTTTLMMTSCPGDTEVAANGSVTRWANFTNTNPYFADQFTYSISDDHGWVIPDNSYFSLQPEETQPLATQIHVPANAPQAEVDHVCVSVGSSTGANVTTCCYDVTVRGTVAVGDDASAAFRLAQNVPNPTLRRTSIEYALPAAGHVRLAIYDVTGAHVRELIDGTVGAGTHTVPWDGLDHTGHVAPAGVYLYRLEFAGRAVQKRMVVVR
jgi:hypothetical protein